MTPFENYSRPERILKAAEKKEGAYITSRPVETYKGASQYANSHNRGEAFFDTIIAVFALYFAAFAFLAYRQNGTMANLHTNQIIFRMASFNPTAFPILFTFLVGKFIKSFANFKLERGATIGTIQHLLGSRTLVTAFLTPLKMGAMNLVALGVILFWVLNPLGGQMSLRTVSLDSNYTTIAMNFHYLDLNTSPFPLVNESYSLPISNSAYMTALFSPAAYKNGTMDMFGNIQMPTIESLKSSQLADSDGWYMAGMLANANESSQSFIDLEDFLGLSNDAVPQTSTTIPISNSLIGIPFARGGPVVEMGYGVNVNQTTDNIQASLTDIQMSLYGPDADQVVNVESQFNIETSYFSTNCSVQSGGMTDNFQDFPKGMDAVNGVVSNNYNFVIRYDSNHTTNSTGPRSLNVTQWSTTNGISGNLTQARCSLTTTYVEAAIYCANANNCSVQAMRPSTLTHPDPNLSQLDGIAPPFNTSKSSVRGAIPELFFSAFINATGNITQNPYALTPTVCYFVNPENPFLCSTGVTDNFLYDIGDELFSQRFTQLLNTYWMDIVAPYSVSGNFTLNSPLEGSASSTAPGQMRVETKVLRCHIPFMVVLVVISIVLFFLGIATAWMDYNRKGPDIFDDFINSLRFNPYVQAGEEGLSMEDGFEKVQRMRGVLVRMGDVKPDEQVGLIAIGTPTQGQPVRMLSSDRRYR